MPANKDFTFCILVGGAELPEYVSGDGQVFVESDLFTPYSYKLAEEGVVQGDTERQKIHVTPYKVKITSVDTTPTRRAFTLCIDGQYASYVYLNPGEKYVFDGFDDGKTVCEFLFSLPRFPMDKGDRMDKNILSHIGKVEVLCYSYTWQRIGTTISSTPDFKQASKKDSYAVTKGDYVMVTTRKGKILDTPSQIPCKVHEEQNDDTSKKHSISDKGTASTQDSYLQPKFTLESALSVTYVMRNTLKGKGFSIKPVNGKNDEEADDSMTGSVETIQADESDDDITLVKISNPNTKRRRMMKKHGPEDVTTVD